MTLVELLVATVLGTILIGVVTFVWLQSNDIFTTTVHRLETYQRLRTVLDVMERDLANTERTMDMEFFVDNSSPKNGHYDPPPAGTDTTFTLSGNDFRTPRDPNDPLMGKDEFGVSGFTTAAPFLHAPSVFSPEPYLITGSGHLEGRAYWRDEVYVRSFASVQGVNRPALVHYRLVQPKPDEPSLLRRRIWFLDTDGKMIAPDPTNGVAGTDQTAILSHGICDLKVGFYFKLSTTQSVGHWYHVGPISGTYGQATATALMQEDLDRGYLPSNGFPGQEATTALSEQHEKGGFFDNKGSKGKLNVTPFYYDGNARIELPKFGPVTMRTLTDGDHKTKKLLGTGDLKEYSNFGFNGVRPGAKVYVFAAVDDDNDFKTSTADAGPFFPGQVLTVESIAADSTQTWVGMIFQEPINFYRLVSTWLGTETEVTVTGTETTSYPKSGPNRTIVGSFNVKYRVGFLPGAFLIRISCNDANNGKVLPMERVIRLLQQ